MAQEDPRIANDITSPSRHCLLFNVKNLEYLDLKSRAEVSS